MDELGEHGRNSLTDEFGEHRRNTDGLSKRVHQPCVTFFEREAAGRPTTNARVKRIAESEHSEKRQGNRQPTPATGTARNRLRQTDPI